MRDFLKLLSIHSGEIDIAGHVLAHGEEAVSAPLTEEQSKTASFLGSCFEAKPKQCFYNAQFLCLLALSRGELLSRLKYVEGYALGGSALAVHHAWVTLDGAVIDLTLSTKKYSVEELTAYLKNGTPLPRESDLSDRVLGVIPEGWVYMGVEYDAGEIGREFVQREASFSVLDDWENDWKALRGS